MHRTLGPKIGYRKTEVRRHGYRLRFKFLACLECDPELRGRCEEYSGGTDISMNCGKSGFFTLTHAFNVLGIALRTESLFPPLLPWARPAPVDPEDASQKVPQFDLQERALALRVKRGVSVDWEQKAELKYLTYCLKWRLKKSEKSKRRTRYNEKVLGAILLLLTGQIAQAM